MPSKKDPIVEEIWQTLREVATSLKETSDGLDKTKRLVAANAKQISGLSDKWGDLGEALTIGETVEIFNTINSIQVHKLYPNPRGTYQDKEWEIDGLAIGDDTVVVIEAKATLRVGHISQFIDKKLKLFTKFEPAFANHKIYGAMGYLSIDSGAKDVAHENGLLLIRPTSTSKELVPRPKNFQLKNFNPKDK